MNKAKVKVTKELVGHVGVDSGQLLIADPCYIDSEWQKKEFIDDRRYVHKKTGKKLRYYGVFNDTKAKKQRGVVMFSRYDDPINEFGDRSMNKMLVSGEVEEIPEEPKHKRTFSYAGVCETTLADEHQIRYGMGHAGIAVAFRSGYGDGYYPVYAYKNEEGRIIRVEILM